MRSTTRVVLVVVLALAMVWALALPGVAKKPETPGNPGGGGGGRGPVLTVDVFDDVHPLPASPDSDEGRMHWILEAGDEIRVWATVTGLDTSEADLCLVTSTEPSGFCEPFEDGVMAAYPIDPDDLQWESFEATVEVRIGGETVLSEALSMQWVGLPDCAFTEVEGGLALSSQDGIECLWHASPAHLGEWKATLDPYGTPNKPTKVFVTLRDHMPGNWCAVSPDEPSGISGRMKPGDAMSVNWLIPDNGICLKDGMSGTASFGVGTAGTYVLVLTGDLTLTRLGG